MVISFRFDFSVSRLLRENEVLLKMFLWFHLQKWHPDKHKGDTAATEKFQEINEAYNGITLLGSQFLCIGT